MKVLIIQTAFLGDVILTTPLIETIKSEFPESEIDILVRKGNEGVFNGHPHLRDVLLLDKKRKYQEVVRLVKTIRSQYYDYLINAQRFLTTGLLTCLSGAKETIGFDKNPLSFCFSQKVGHEISPDGQSHEVDRNLSLLDSLCKTKIRKPRLYTSNHQPNILVKGPYICMAPCSKWFTKEWPREKWAALIQKIPSQYHIYLIGAKEDIIPCQHIHEQSGGSSRVEVVAGQLKMMESAHLIEHAEMTFTNDSGPLHFASATNAPVTAIFCSTIPAFGFGPLSDHSVIVETKHKLDCRPCGLHGKKACPLGHFKCGDIDADEVLLRSGLKTTP